MAIDDTGETKKAAHRSSQCGPSDPFNPNRCIRHHPPANSDSVNDLATSELETAHGEPGAAAVAIDDTGETKKAAHRFSAIRMRSLNDPRQSSLPTVPPLNP